MYFSGDLSIIFQTRFAKRVGDCDELASNGCDENLMWFSGRAKTVSIDIQDWVVMASAVLFRWRAFRACS